MSENAPVPVRIESLAGHLGSRVRLLGWLYNRRSSKKLHFLEVRDGTGIVQCVVSRADVGDEAFALAGECGQESSLELTGRARAEPRAKGGVEIQVDDIAVL